MNFKIAIALNQPCGHCVELLLAIAIAALFAVMATIAQAQPGLAHPVEGQAGLQHNAHSGFITDRLSTKELQRWSEIAAVALAVDANGQPLRPTLWGLWKWAETSPHAIYILLPDAVCGSTSACTAGSFSIKRFDPRGQRHVAMIRLHLANIDRACVGPRARRANGFIPFKSLTREERYAEVLGHELAHAAWILSDLERARAVYELVEQTNEMFIARAHWRAGEPIESELQHRLTKRDSLLESLEEQAGAIEQKIWQELVTSRKAKARIRWRSS
jgi:hypothetical protein